jgi:multidrug resistance efflux pump
MENLTPKAFIITLACCLLAACSSGAAQTTGAAQAGAVSNVAQFQAAPTALPTRAVVASTSVSADGVLSTSVPVLSLGFDQSGKVVSVNVTPGQSVKKGDLLAAVDDTTLQDAVADAQLALAQAQASIGQQNEPTSQADIDAAQASLNAAYASYNTTKAGNSQSDIDAAERNIEAAWLAYLSAQVGRDHACGGPQGLASNDCKSNEASYGNAFENWVSAKETLAKLQEPVSQDTLTQAYASVVSAKAKIESLQAGVTDEQQKVDTAQIAQAQAALDLATANLSKARLVSPCNCVVQAVNVSVGATAPNSAFTLVDLTGLQFQTSNLTERDVAKIQVGAKATLRLKAYAETFSGTVSAVLAQSSGTLSDAALYTVLIDLAPAQVSLLPGMTGQADITLG